MKTTKLLAAITILLATPFLLRAADTASKPYPLETCFISGDKFAEMGRPIVFIYAGQEIKVCCKDCKKQFNKNPAAGMKKLEEAVAAKASSSRTSSVK
jgi:hypothetical protein